MKTHSGDMTTSYLTIANADIGDSGVYKCAPSNTGPASVKVHVFLHGKCDGYFAIDLELLLARVNVAFDSCFQLVAPPKPPSLRL